MGAILEDIIRDGKRAGGVVHNLRAMLSNAPATREVCCVNELIREVVEFTHSELVGQDIELQQTLEPSLPRVQVARVEIQQVLVNLVINAIHAMQDAVPGRRLLQVRSEAEPGRVTVVIRDHGCGIPPDQLETIFNPFFTTKPSGLGMGLAICRRLISSNQGSIRASNHHAGGAEFAFSLPVLDAPTPLS
jgi:C4-dicarboxylate-specific signal transduction histidine kinase